MSTKSARILALLSLFAIPLLFSTSASAITIGNDVELEFTLESSISITTSGSLSIEGLISGGEAATSTSSLVVTVDSNSAGGYTLGATVGSSANASTSLTSSTVGYGSFSMLSSSDDAISLSSFTGNSWGISIDGGSTFIGLPLYTETAKTIKTTTSTASSDTLSIKLGARAASGVESGTYTNVINFIAVTQLPPFDGITTMQAMTPTICESTAVGSSKQLIDTRDNKLYWVTKLADGNCWMTQNLDYDIQSSGNIVALTSDGSATTWSSDYAPQATSTSTSVFNDSSTTDTYSYDPGNYYLVGGSGTETAITCTSSSNGGENCHYHLGNYYQWNAVTAGTGGTITSADATASICPVGWRLPTSNSYTNYSFGKLTNTYNITNGAYGSSDAALLSSPLWFVRAGYVNSGTLSYYGSQGEVWSSRAYTDTDMAYLLSLSSNSVSPSTLYDRDGGLSARCVAISQISNIPGVTTMQQFGGLSSSEKTAVLSSMTEGTAYRLTDTRDNETYYVAKLADGNVWMLDNLRLGGDSAITLTTSDSNVSSSYTLPASGSWTSSSQNSYITSYIASDYYNNTVAGVTYGSGSGKIGVYYNFCAASAGTVCSDSNSSNASYDICPKGWRLPTGGSSGEFQALYDAYSGNVTNFRSAMSTLLSGDFNAGSAHWRGMYGFFWSSTSGNSTDTYVLYIDSSDTMPAYSGDRRSGYSIRCISQ